MSRSFICLLALTLNGRKDANLTDICSYSLSWCMMPIILKLCLILKKGIIPFSG